MIYSWEKKKKKTHKRQSGTALKCIRYNNEMEERKACYLKEESELLHVTEKVEVFLFHFGCFILYEEVNWDQTLNMVIIDNKG